MPVPSVSDENSDTESENDLMDSNHSSPGSRVVLCQADDTPLKSETHREDMANDETVVSNDEQDNVEEPSTSDELRQIANDSETPTDETRSSEIVLGSPDSVQGSDNPTSVSVDECLQVRSIASSHHRSELMINNLVSGTNRQIVQ